MKVFGKYKIGDIVVSIEDNIPYRYKGDMYKVLDCSEYHCLYYKPSLHSRDVDDWRLATPEELKAYYRGIKNIKDITPTMFRKGQYIVTLMNSGYVGKINYCNKQSKDNEELSPEIDTGGYKNSSNSDFLASDLSFTKWRWATDEEEDEYERRGKPYDVTEIDIYKPGTWLSLIGWNKPYFLKVESSDSSKIVSQNWIRNNEYFKYEGHFTFSDCTNINQVDPSVPAIQNCLPQDHPDKIKINQLQKGEIYKHNTDKGSIFMYNKGVDAYYYIGDSLRTFNKEGGNFRDDPDQYILATKEEADWLRKCIKADRFIPLEEMAKKEYNYIVVHCKTQAEFDSVIDHYKFSLYKHYFNTYTSNSCIVVGGQSAIGTYCGIDYFKKESSNSLIHEFDDWVQTEGLMGNWLKSNPCNEIPLEGSYEYKPFKEIEKLIKSKQHINKNAEHQNPIIVKRKITKRKSILTI